METAERVSVHPEPFVNRQSAHCFTRFPPYSDWNTKAYLAKADWELRGFALASQKPLDMKHQGRLSVHY